MNRYPSFNEAEIQALILLVELEQPKETPNNNHYRFFPKSVVEAVRYFKGFEEDWSSALIGLESQGLVEPGSGNGGVPYRLTQRGLKIAYQVRDSRPPIYYWYREYALLTAHSPAYAEFCRRLYGLNLCQANFSDMEQIEKLIEVTNLNKNSRVLDLGCNKGMIAEYLSDRTGAYITGLDYTPEAIQQAVERTESKRPRLEFKVGNLDELDFPPGSFDTLISIDTLYMPNNLEATLQQMLRLLTPGGQIAAFYSDLVEEESSVPQQADAARTQLGEALTRSGLSYQDWDFSAQTYLHMQKKHQIGLEMRALFEAEGNQVLYNYILADSEANSRPYDPEDYRMRRFLYRIILNPPK